MPFPMKIQPIGSQQPFRESTKPPVLKARLKRLFDRPFNNVLKTSSVAGDKLTTGSGEVKDLTAAVIDFEPSSLCLDNMVQNFIEENSYDPKPPAAAQKCGRHRCNCFHGNQNDSSDDDEPDFGSGESVITSNTNSYGDSLDVLKSLIPCATKVERNLLADVSKMVESNKTCKRKDALRKIVSDGLLALGFNASICQSKWEKSSSIPAGEYEYIDVKIDGERVLIDIDFRSEFEIARSTGSYKATLQSLPFIFVGKVDRLQQIIAIVSEAARQSLKKKGMHIAPWRKAEYIRAKWLSPFVRTTSSLPPGKISHDGAVSVGPGAGEGEIKVGEEILEEIEFGELELIFVEETTTLDEAKSFLSSPLEVSGGEVHVSTPVRVVWQPPVVKPKSSEKGNRVMVTGLASLLKEKP